MVESVSIFAAFGAGIVSFIAPCTLALVPAFLVYLSSFTIADRASADPARLRVATFLNTVLFVLGFTAVFVALGSSLGALSSAVGTNTIWLNRVGGALVIFFGLSTFGLIKLSFMEKGFAPKTDWARKFRYAGSFLVGGTFAVGWVPCVGPILAAIFALAGTSGSAESGALLLLAYSLGMMLPFLGAGLFAGWTTTAMRRYGNVLQYAGPVGGVLLVLLGIAVFTNLISEGADLLPTSLL